MTTFYTIALTVISYHLLLTWIAGHRELTDAFTANVKRFWARLTRNFGETEEQPYVDPHAEHVKVKRSYNSLDNYDGKFNRNKDLFHN